ncbi:hypothetical protein N7493_009980 [Penicillium malachiteum]|uniref:Uncharacterized protein n=1 Tax=Penicillium malachiteum TaxID=1324776 RepID=A0AAD6MS37_9EURO|nr:hypothetical protein N7493_009980 [Penicillium malachiteum]
MDENGYLTFSSKAVSLVNIPTNVMTSPLGPEHDIHQANSGGIGEVVHVRAEDGSIWQESDDAKRASISLIPNTMAVYLGSQASIGAMEELEAPESDSDDDTLDWFEQRRLLEIALLI